MGKTLRTNLEDETYDKTQHRQKSIRGQRHGAHSNIEPYAPAYRWGWKFVVDPGLGLGVSRTGKLVAKNANRSLKKAMRQKAKQEIKTLIDGS